MKPVNIYTLTRAERLQDIRRLERQMSKREDFLNIKAWEVKGLRVLAELLHERLDAGTKPVFFYSFTIPKLGKEFDLLRISGQHVVNVELKSGNISDEAIVKQLKLNKYYLSSLERAVHLYTYVSDSGRLVRLTNSGNLIDADWNELIADVSKIIDYTVACEGGGESDLSCSEPSSDSVEDIDSDYDGDLDLIYTGDIEKLFDESKFMVSPITEPERFLRRDYLLTSQQKDIRKHIMKDIEKHASESLLTGFTGLPGTGKTMLLYDLAMQLSERNTVCVIHGGPLPGGLQYLDVLLKRVIIMSGVSTQSAGVSSRLGFKDTSSAGSELQSRLERITSNRSVACILIDEAHKFAPETLKILIEGASERGIPVVFSYDSEEAIAVEERGPATAEFIRKLPHYVEYRLTNRIRTNKELSSFIYSIVKLEAHHGVQDYPSVEVVYAGSSEEADFLLDEYIRAGYTYIYEDASEVTAEADSVVMLVDENFYYDMRGYLRYRDSENEQISPVKTLFYGLNRARKRLAVVILDNEQVLDAMLMVLQGQ